MLFCVCKLISVVFLPYIYRNKASAPVEKKRPHTKALVIWETMGLARAQRSKSATDHMVDAKNYPEWAKFEDISVG